jgi:hypothetical protein
LVADCFRADDFDKLGNEQIEIDLFSIRLWEYCNDLRVGFRCAGKVINTELISSFSTSFANLTNSPNYLHSPTSTGS